MAAPYIQKSAAERGSAQFAIGCRTDSERRRVCCKFRCKCSKTTTRRTVRVVWDAPAPASGSRALRPGSFIGPMQQTRDSPESGLIFQVKLNHRLLSAEAGPACRRVPRPASSTRWAASTGLVHDIAPQPPVTIGRERCDNSAQSTRTYHPTAPYSLCFRLAKSLGNRLPS